MTFGKRDDRLNGAVRSFELPHGPEALAAFPESFDIRDTTAKPMANKTILVTIRAKTPGEKFSAPAMPYWRGKVESTPAAKPLGMATIVSQVCFLVKPRCIVESFTAGMRTNNRTSSPERPEHNQSWRSGKH